MIPAPIDNTPRNLAAGTALLLPAATEPERALVVALCFLLVTAGARMVGAVALQRAPQSAFGLVFLASSLVTGVVWQALLAVDYALGSALTLVVGLLIINPAILHSALGHRDGTDAAAPPPFVHVVWAPGLLLVASVLVYLLGDTLSVLAQPAGLLLCAGLLLAAANAHGRRD